MLFVGGQKEGAADSGVQHGRLMMQQDIQCHDGGLAVAGEAAPSFEEARKLLKIDG